MEELAPAMDHSVLARWASQEDDASTSDAMIPQLVDMASSAILTELILVSQMEFVCK